MATERYRCLECVITDKADCEAAIGVYLGQDKVAIKISPITWEQAVSKRLKMLIYKGKTEAIIILESEVWNMSKRNRSRLRIIEGSVGGEV